MSHLAISLLGPFQVTLDGKSVTRFKADTARALLAYLAMQADVACRRDTLAGLLWPDQPEAVAHQNLRQALSRLRSAIADREAVRPLLLTTRKTIRFNPESDHWLDAVEFNRLIDASNEHRHRRLQVCQSCIHKLRKAAQLYRGDLLAGFSLNSAPFEEWLVVHRERLHRRALEALHHLAAYNERRGNVDRILHYAQRLVELEPWHEEAHRQWMRALVLNGQRNSALAQYEACRRILAAELGIEPAAETTALYEGIREGIDARALVRVPPSNLPVPLTPLIGREAELTEIDDRLQDPACRLLTLVGPGGIGKTRLALEAAAEQTCDFQHGVTYVSLASLRSVESLVPTVAQALGFAFYGKDEPGQQLLRYLRQKEMLLVLDNYEHLLPTLEPAPSETDPGDRSEGVSLVVDILCAAPKVRLLITSRVRLNVPAEQLLHVGGIDYPPLAPSTPDGVPAFKESAEQGEAARHRTKGFPAQDAARYSAVQLFVRSARQVQEEFEPTDEDLTHVARICQMVQGMPLAILLAAAWMEVLSPAEIAARVGRELAFLEADWRGVAERHRSMIAVFDTSWRMLSAAERAAFKRLSVFRGGFTAEAAEAVAGASLSTLRGLAHKSFLGREAAGRYEVHELLRQYAARKLGEMPSARKETFDLHCAYYSHFLAQRQDAFRKRGPGDALAEMANLRAAWSWALQHGRLPEICRSLDGIFWLLGLAWSRNRERAALLTQAVNLLRKAEPTQEHQVGLGLALCYLAWSQARLGLREAASSLAQEGLSLLRRQAAGRVLAHGYTLAVFSGVAQNETDAKSLLEQALGIAQEAKGSLEACWIHATLAGIAMRRQAYDEAQGHLSTFLKIAQAIDHRRGEAIILGDLGELAYLRGQYARARIFHEQGLDILRELGMRDWLVLRLNALGEVALADRDPEQARARFQEALSLSEELNDPMRMACALCGLGEVAQVIGDVPAARSRYRRALQVAQEDSRVDALRHTLVSVSKWVAHEGKQALAVELVASALNIRPAHWRETLRGTEALLNELRSALSSEVYAAAQARGRARDLEATVEELLAELSE